ncbi:hypothetical protein ACHAXA_008526 [Cyclostephanos tholiformis]|uniref:Peptidase C14 caspase domain-containing protein n=1 Tax=Cyclostephanos tholiformis TaxID=382380 RepID=A0ABD3R158_9STRA
MGFFKMASSSYPAALNRINQQPPQQQQQQQQQQQSRPTPATTANPPHPPYQRATIISDCALVPSPVATTTAAVVPPPPSYHTPPSSSIVGVVRVPVPNGMSPGERIRVRLPDGTEVVHAIPHTSEWQYDGGGRTVPYFHAIRRGRDMARTRRMSHFRVISACDDDDDDDDDEGAHSRRHATRTAYTRAIAGRKSRGTEDRTAEIGVVWRHYRVTAPSHYDPPPVGVRSVPCIPRGVYSSHLPPNGRHKALLVGINYEGTRARLRGCVNDAKCMMNLLRRNGYPDDGSHMLLLSDERSRGMEYQPTTENILKALKWFMKDVRRGDVLFFHFSGHGGQVPDKGGHEADGYNETIVPVDFQSKGQITDDVLWGSLVYDLPEGSRLTALMDMCHSGTGLDLPFDYDLRTRRWREDINPAHSAGDVVLFSGCEDSQTSADVGGGYGKMAGGAMTQAFTSAYEQTAALSTYHDFLEALRRQLKSKGFKQRPQLTSSQMFEAESRIFSLGCQASLSGGLPSYIEPNHNATIGRDKRRHIRPARQGFGVGGRNDIFGMAGGIIAGAIIADMLF